MPDEQNAADMIARFQETNPPEDDELSEQDLRDWAREKAMIDLLPSETLLDELYHLLNNGGEPIEYGGGGVMSKDQRYYVFYTTELERRLQEGDLTADTIRDALKEQWERVKHSFPK